MRLTHCLSLALLAGLLVAAVLVHLCDGPAEVVARLSHGVVPVSMLVAITSPAVNPVQFSGRETRR